MKDKKCNKISVKIVREIVSDILIQRSNIIMQDYEEMMQKKILECRVTSGYSGEVASTSCGTRVLADDVR